MKIDNLIREIVREEIAELDIQTNGDPVLIRIDDAAKMCGIDRCIIDNLVKDAPGNGFPSIRLSQRIVLIDQSRLYRWFAAGGLKGVVEAKDLKGSKLRLAS